MEGGEGGGTRGWRGSSRRRCTGYVTGCSLIMACVHCKGPRTPGYKSPRTDPHTDPYAGHHTHCWALTLAPLTLVTTQWPPYWPPHWPLHWLPKWPQHWLPHWPIYWPHTVPYIGPPTGPLTLALLMQPAAGSLCVRHHL